NSLCIDFPNGDYGVFFSKVGLADQSKANIFLDRLDVENKNLNSSTQITFDTAFFTPRDIKIVDSSILILSDKSFQRIVDNVVLIDSTKIYLIEADFHGRVIQQMEIQNTNRYNYASSFLVSDSSFTISSTVSNRTINPDGYNIKCFDQFLNLLWEVEQPIITLSGSIPILESMSDSILLLGGSALFDNGMIPRRGDAKIDVFNINGNVINQIWRERTRTQFLVNSLYSINNEKFLGCGLDDNALLDLGGIGAPRIFKSNIEGDNIWDHTYWDGNLNLSHSYLNNVVELSDGQIMAGGVYIDFENHLGNSPFKCLVILTDSLGCINGDCNDLIITSVENPKNEALETIKIFPNPTTDILNINSPFDVEAVQIVNMLGENIFKQEIEGNQKQFAIDANFLPNGTYMAHLHLKNKRVYTSRFIKLN
ncbi:MAG: T9SS type A sorting domain-containing protein, partial [Saprospiraceae bacterium]|nr:T9SS type A sorting domain-containing protein [Saprospiraceae bacterium]